MDLNTVLGLGFILLISVIASIVISSLPLYISVKLLGGKASMMRVFFTNMLMAFLTFYSMKTWGFGVLAIILLTVIIYMLMFKLGMIRAFFAWLLQYFVAAFLVYLVITLLGITLPAPKLF